MPKARSSYIRRDVVEAYRPLARLLAGRLTLDGEAEQYQQQFELLDADGDGNMTFMELESAMCQKLGDGNYEALKATKDTLKLLFEILDADGSGAISSATEAPLFLSVVSKTHSCNNCGTILDPLVDEGYRCTDCYRINPEAATDLCTSCHKGQRAACAQHGPAPMQPASKVCLQDPPVLSLQLAVHDGLRVLQCECCGEWHDIVLSYLNSDANDLHLRPTKNGSGFVCEWCAVRICGKCPTNNMKWKAKTPEKGMASRASKSFCFFKSCAGNGTFKGWEAVEQEAKQRLAANCRTCAAKLERGEPMQLPSANPQPIHIPVVIEEADVDGQLLSIPEGSDTELDRDASTAAKSQAEADSSDSKQKQAKTESSIFEVAGKTKAAAIFNQGVEAMLENTDALGFAREACEALEKIAKLIPIVGRPIEGIAGYAKHVIIMAEQVPYNRGKARSLANRAQMVAFYLQGVLAELEAEVLNHMSAIQQQQLDACLKRLHRAMEKSKALVVKWAALTSGEKAAKVVARIVQNKMDIVDLKDVDNDITKAMTDLSTFMTSLSLLHQIRFQHEVRTAMAVATDAAPERIAAADMKDWASLQTDIVNMAGSVDALKQQLSEDQELAREWQEAVLPMMRSMGVTLDRIDSAVQDILQDVRDIKDCMGQAAQELRELKHYLKQCMKAGGVPGPQQGGQLTLREHSSVRPRLLIAADQVKFQGSARGEGAFAEVHKGKWRGVDVAVKRLKMSGVEEEEAEQVYREALMLTHLVHPCIVPFYGMIIESSPENTGKRVLQGGLVMELCDGSLQDLLDSGEEIELPRALQIACRIASGLNYLHTGADMRVVHGDLKPQNVLIKGDGAEVKICDFGLSNTIHIGAMTQGGTILTKKVDGNSGSLLWLAPEVCEAIVKGTQVASEPARDIYAFGLILYQLVTGRRPFSELGRMSEMQLRQAIMNGVRPSGLQQWLRAMTAAADGSSISEVATAVADLIRVCWAGASQERPTAQHVVDELELLMDRC